MILPFSHLCLRHCLFFCSSFLMKLVQCAVAAAAAAAATVAVRFGNQMDQKTLSCVTHLMHNMLPVRALEWIDF